MMKMSQFSSDSTVNGKINIEEPLEYVVDNEIKIEIFKGVRTFGLILVGGASDPHSPGDNGIYVSKVSEGGLAELDGRIVAGDQIVAIKQYIEDGDAYTFSFDGNGNVTPEDVKQLLRRCKGRVAIFIVRKNQERRNNCGPPDNTKEHLVIEPDHGDSVVRIHPPYKSRHQNEEANGSHCANSDLSLERSSNTNQSKKNTSKLSNISSSSSSEDQPCTPHNSCVKFIHFTTLNRSNSWCSSITKDSTDCSLNYRDMAKFGIRPTSLSSESVIKPLKSNFSTRRIKNSWSYGRLSSSSIDEDAEEEPCISAFHSVQKRCEDENKQRVL